MNPRFRVYAISLHQVVALDIIGLTVVGGSKSSGVTLDGLKYKDDYAVLSPSATGVSVHCFKGARERTVIDLQPMQHLALHDLILFMSPETPLNIASQQSDDSFAEDVERLVAHFANPGDSQAAFAALLEIALERFQLEKGLLITRRANQQFEVVAERGLQRDDPWLSESLILETVSSGRPTMIQNLVGSRYETSRSLVATGLLSIFAWPLITRGENLGVLVVGSTRPHSGLDSTQLRQAEVFVRIAAVLLWFYLRDQNQQAELKRLQVRQDEAPFLTTHPALLETCDLATRVAGTELSVFIAGETGVGKELLARWIHDHSDRKHEPFVAVNCGAIPADLLESILFGHRKGAFTGAHSDQLGKFQQANGGTLFLDEIGDLPLTLQVKLLRALQEKQIEPVGAARAVRIDVRLLTATHKPVAEMSKQGLFREDLFYRVAEIKLKIPPLRERPRDISLLAQYFLQRFAKDKVITRDGLAWLESQLWPGNVRELMSAVKRAGLLSRRNDLGIADFMVGHPSIESSVSSGWLGGPDLESAKNKFVHDKVREALARSGGKRNLAAELLSITPRTLFRYLVEMKEMTDLSSSTDPDVMSDLTSGADSTIY